MNTAPQLLPLSAEQVIDLLGLEPLPLEGGFYRETFRSPLVVPEAALPSDYYGDRNASTAIYFLLTPEERSTLHILPTDEVFHFYSGDPVEMLRLYPDDAASVATLGDDLLAGERPQLVVPAGVWQGCRLAPGGQWALLGCTVAPGFDYRDFYVASPVDVLELVERHPQHERLILELSPRELE